MLLDSIVRRALPQEPLMVSVENAHLTHTMAYRAERCVIPPHIKATSRVLRISVVLYVVATNRDLQSVYAGKTAGSGSPRVRRACESPHFIPAFIQSTFPNDFNRGHPPSLLSSLLPSSLRLSPLSFRFFPYPESISIFFPLCFHL